MYPHVACFLSFECYHQINDKVLCESLEWHDVLLLWWHNTPEVSGGINESHWNKGKGKKRKKHTRHTHAVVVVVLCYYYGRWPLVLRAQVVFFWWRVLINMLVASTFYNHDTHKASWRWYIYVMYATIRKRPVFRIVYVAGMEEKAAQPDW